jgi:hypothetical protein
MNDDVMSRRGAPEDFSVAGQTLLPDGSLTRHADSNHKTEELP